MLTLSDADLTRWLGELFWPFLRTLALFSAAPAFSSIAIPPRVKIALAFVVACLVAATVKQSAPLALSWATVILVAEQVLVGLAIGFAMQLALAAMAFAGDLIGVQMGFGFAGLLDIQNRFEVPVISDFFGLVGLLLFLGLNGHLVLLGVLVKSFDVVPIAVGSGVAVAGWRVLVGSGAALFQMGVWLALPVVAVLAAAQLAMALMSRVVPQINIMSVGFSVFMWVGIAATIALLPYFVPAVEHMIETGLKVVAATIGDRYR
ncbi:MAG: flagellar biosynthetic protein FliR [Stellaceae bacterium]